MSGNSNSVKDKPYLRLVDLHKDYGETRALRGVSLEVHSGEIFGLIGPDGAGKTTVMRIACGLILPDRGRAQVLGFDCRGEVMRVKEHLGYMPQRFSLYPDLTVAENIRFFADLYLVPEGERQEREQRLMEFSRLAPFRNRRANDLSGGMKQKLALSCTLIHTPDLLVLDEPTTGVDPVSRREFWTILRELAEGGMALLISTPYMDEAKLCDHVALMHHGRVIAHGTPEAVAGRFDRHLIEITGNQIDEARRILLESGLDDLDVHRLGDRLHMIFQDEATGDYLRRILADFDVALEPVEPTIEDTFVSLMSQFGEEAA